MNATSVSVCKCGHSELRHEIPIITSDGKVSEMRCNLCNCSDYVPIRSVIAMEAN